MSIKKKLLNLSTIGFTITMLIVLLSLLVSNSMRHQSLVNGLELQTNNETKNIALAVWNSCNAVAVPFF